MTMHINKAAVLTLSLAVLVLASSVAANSTITLRASVRLPADRTEVRLADIAVIDGEAESRYGDLVIANMRDASGVLEIPVREVRNALDEAGVHWGRTHLNGRRVLVRPSQSSTRPPQAMTAIAIEGAEQNQQESQQNEPNAHSAASIRNERTLRGAIADYLIHNLHVGGDDLRLSFERRHEEILRTPEHEYRFEIEPVSGLRGARVDLAVRFWSDGEVDRRETVTVSPSVRMPIVVLVRPVSRGATLTESDLEIKYDWRSPGSPGLVTDPSEVVGRLAATRLREGETLREQHVRRRTMIRRGEQVIVRCVVGNTVIALQAEARENGSKDDTIEFRKIGERETFLATVTGPNEAIVDLRR